MPVQFKIEITKEIILRSKDCGVNGDPDKIGSDCAIAWALRDIFPEVYVTDFYIYPFGAAANGDLKILLPLVAQQFIKLFDGFRLMPKMRLLLPEFEFEIDVPDRVINAINIDEIKDLINTAKQAGISYKPTHNVVLH